MKSCLLGATQALGRMAFLTGANRARTVLRAPSSFFCRPLSTRLVLPEAGVPEVPAKTSEEVVRNLTESVIGGPASYDPQVYMRQRERLLSKVPSSQAELPARRMSDSFDQALIPLGSDLRLRDRYLTHLGSVRVGRLLEDMDVFAVHLVFQHLLNPMQAEDDPQ